MKIRRRRLRRGIGIGKDMYGCIQHTWNNLYQLWNKSHTTNLFFCSICICSPCVPMRERHECHCMLFLTEDNDFAGEETVSWVFLLFFPPFHHSAVRSLIFKTLHVVLLEYIIWGSEGQMWRLFGLDKYAGCWGFLWLERRGRFWLNRSIERFDSFAILEKTCLVDDMEKCDCQHIYTRKAMRIISRFVKQLY